MSRKQLPPAPGGDGLAAALRARHQPDPPTPAPRRAVDDVPRADPMPPPATRDRGTAAPRQPTAEPSRPAMVRRSWYLPADTADALAGLVDDLHHETRTPRHIIWAAIGDQLTAHRDQLRDRLPPRK